MTFADMFLQLNELNPKNHRTILLYSGGFDSTLVGLLLKENGIKTVALSIDYLNRSRAEIKAANQLISKLEFTDFIKFNLPLKDVHDQPDKWPSPLHEGWFPYKNVIFFGIATHLARWYDCNVIAAGIRVWDGNDFDDATLSFFCKLGDVLQYSGFRAFSGNMKLFLPLIDNHELAEKALFEGGEVAQILKNTWSCWRDGPEPCNECVECRTRSAFFNKIAEMKGD